jgi:hypothetical protein
LHSLIYKAEQDEETGELEDYQIRIQQLPASWEKETARLLPEPVPPVVGKVFDGAGKESPKYGHDDPQYVKDRGQWEDRKAALKIRDATIDDRITWQTSEALRSSDIRAYCDGVFAELISGFTRGELNHWLLAINSIDTVGGADIALAEEGLLQLIKRVVRVPDVEEVQVEGTRGVQ